MMDQQSPHFDAISACRACGNAELVPVLDLGEQALTGVFPRSLGEEAGLTRGPLALLKCHGDPSRACGLLQLAHNYAQTELYGEHYGYRSGLNGSMVRHLLGRVARLLSARPLDPGDVVLDIGSNDGTTLGAYPADLTRIGMDPTAAKFQRFYPPGVAAVPEFFSAESFLRASGGRKARCVTSISMFYDLPEPQRFVAEVAQVLADDGRWLLEQAYLPAMLDNLTYDTVCHEHLEHYCLAQVEWLLGRAGLCVLDVETNDVNGGSFTVLAGKRRAGGARGTDGGSPRVAAMRDDERSRGVDTLAPFEDFARRAARHRVELQEAVAGVGTRCVTPMAEGVAEG